jgi:hypothetical protein
VTYLYQVYGLSLRSSTILPPFTIDTRRNASEADVTLTVSAQPPAWVRLTQNLESSVRYAEPGYFGNPTQTVIVFGADQLFELAYSDGARFAINADASQIWARSDAVVTADDIAVYLQGPIMGFVLRRRGIISLHASAVSIAGHAVILCGPSESGKSTTAAALGLRGTPVLSDDITPIRGENSQFWAESGHRRVCLWPQAVRDLFGDADALPHLKAQWDKRFLSLDEGSAKFDPSRRRIAAIYILSSRDAGLRAPRIEELNSQEAFFALVQNTYMNWLLDRDQRAAEFDALSRVVMRVPMKRIIPHSDSARLGKLCDLILSDAEGLISATQAGQEIPVF